MKRIILHWTAGRNKVTATDKKHYHFIVDGDGVVHAGNLPPEANLSTADGEYAAHTRGTNTGAIGLAAAGMWNAKERPFNPGPSPMTQVQIDAMTTEAARLAKKYKIPVRRDTILTHAEVEPTLGIKQRGKWDITWLPGMAKVGKPVDVGDRLRGMIKAEIEAMARPIEKPAAKSQGWLAALIQAIFGGRA